MPQQLSLFKNQDKCNDTSRVNPKIPYAGPADKHCKDCDHLRKKEYHNKRYYKCKIVGYSNGAGTDIRLKWPACCEFKPSEE